MAESPEVDPERRKTGQLRAEDLDKDYEYAKRFNRSYLTDRDLLEQLAGDEDGLGMVLQTQTVMASGLKVLKLSPGDVTPTAATVADGRYAARQPLGVLLHPSADAAAKAFVAWLQTPEAAAAMAPHYVYGVHPADAPKAPPAGQPAAAGDGPPIAGPISGAVAVLPAQSLSAYFLMDNPANHAAWEEAITSALAADGRLKLVDRSQIDRVLAERRLDLLAEGPRTAIVSANVFVLSQVVTEGQKSFLRIQAIFGPAASLLAELKLPIDPARPTRFDVPLADQVNAWWPAVLREVSRAKQHPAWSVVDVYSDRPEDYEAADAVAAALGDRLKRDDRAFLADYRAMPELQQEVLMAMIGLGRFGGGRLTPAADYLLEGRLTGPATLELRLLAGRSLRPLATTRIDAAAPPEMFDRAGRWLDAQVAAHANRPADPGAESAAPEGFEWARRQARLELAAAEALDAKIKAPAAGDRASAQRAPRRLRRHVERSAHLDPSLEAAVLWMARLLQDRGRSPDPGTPLEAAMAVEQFVRRFPESSEHRGMMEHCIQDYEQLSFAQRRTLVNEKNRTNDTRDAQQRRLRTFYLGKAVDLFRQYAARYVEVYDRPEERRGSWFSFPGFMDHYLTCEAEYLYLTEATPGAIDEAVRQWSPIFDAHPQAGPHGDFVRLLALGYRNDKPGFLAQALAMQQRHPDPKDAYWQRGLPAADGEMSRLFGRPGLSFWREGKTAVGQLPYADYDPAKDTHQPTCAAGNERLQK